MKETKEMKKVNNNIFSRIGKSIKNFFWRFKKKEKKKVKDNKEVENNIVKEETQVVSNKAPVPEPINLLNEQEIEEFNRLLKKDISISDLSNEEIEKLIRICNIKIDEVDRKIENKQDKIAKNQRLINDLRRM